MAQRVPREQAGMDRPQRYSPHPENIGQLQERRVDENGERVFLEEPWKTNDGLALLPELAGPEA